MTTNPIPVKAALEMLGRHRRPSAAADGAREPRERAAIRTALEQQGLLVAGGTLVSRTVCCSGLAPR